MTKNILLVVALGLSSTLSFAAPISVSCGSATVCPANSQFVANATYFTANPVTLSANANGTMQGSGTFTVKSGVTTIAAGQSCGTINAGSKSYACAVGSSFNVSPKRPVASITIQLNSATTPCSCVLSTVTTGGGGGVRM